MHGHLGKGLKTSQSGRDSGEPAVAANTPVQVAEASMHPAEPPHPLPCSLWDGQGQMDM